MTSTAAGNAAGRQWAGLFRRARSADLIISVVLLAVFVAVFFGAQDWPFRTRLFPVMVAAFGVTLALLNVIRILVGWGERGEATQRIADVEIKDEDDEELEALEYVFESASRSEWFRVLAWVAGFFVALYLLGAVVAIPVFTVLYLLVEARTTVVVAAVYAAVLGGLVYAAREMLSITLPAGTLLGG
jgi:hypothetical protein